MDVLRAQIAVAAEPAGGQQRRARMDDPLLPVRRPDGGAHYGSVVEQEPLGGRADEQLSVLPHQSLADEEIVGHVGFAAAPVSEDGHRLPHMDVQRSHPVECLGVSLDDPGRELRVATGVDLAHDLHGRRGVDIAGVGRRAADGQALLDEHDARTLPGCVGRCADSGHPAAKDQEVDRISRVAHE
jgi:hypothetical protein